MSAEAPAAPVAPYVLNRRDGEFRSMFGTLMAVRAPKESIGGAYSVFDSWGPEGGGSPPHIHHLEDEAWYLVSGRAEVHCGDQTFEIGAGTFVYLPKGVPHCILMFEDLHQVILGSPGGAEGFLRALASEADADTPVEMRAPEPEDFPKMIEASEAHSVEMLGPDAWEKPWPGQEGLVLTPPGDDGWEPVEGGRARLLIDAERSAGAYTILEVELDGTGPVALRTADSLEGWYVLEGGLTATIEGTEQDVQEHGFALLSGGDALVVNGPTRAFVTAPGDVGKDGFKGWA